MEESKSNNEDCNNEGTLDNEEIVKTSTLNVVTPSKKPEGSSDNEEIVETLTSNVVTPTKKHEGSLIIHNNEDVDSTSRDDELAIDKNKSEETGSIMKRWKEYERK